MRSFPAGKGENSFTQLSTWKGTNADPMDATESVCPCLINNKFCRILNKHDEIKCTTTARSKKQIYS